MAVTITTNGKIPKVLPQAVVEAVAKCACCPQGSGSGSGSGRPCGCSPCDCCEGICWWKTDWPSTWVATDGIYATGALSPEWLMTDYSMTLQGPFDEFYWGGEVVGTPGSCALTFASKLNNDCSTGDAPIVLAGTIEYTRTIAPFDVKTYTVRLRASIQIQFSCPDPSGYVFAQFNGFESDDPDYTGFSIGSSTGNGFLDYAMATDSGTDETGVDLSTCSFTVSSLTAIGLPVMSIVGVA
ncbi:MAG TPA: hypothetical protein PLN21_09485 [Gemmatales bacterium]|nr:hypothetical protein [Gemmatales bacterium]